MAMITAVERVKYKRRSDVWIDGEKAFSLGVELIALRGVRAGRDISDAEIVELQDLDERQEAVAASLKLLSMSPRSEKDLRQRLRRRGLGRPAADAAVARMRELGYLDDARFAKSYVESRQSSTPRSRRFLAFELGQKGVARELSAPALDKVSDEDA
ncbi:MAG TPA: RecX family transcriptional regulator, partial [Dehalococcoidia bacterium]